MTDDEHFDKSAYNQSERRKKIRRTGKDRREQMRWERSIILRIESQAISRRQFTRWR